MQSYQILDTKSFMAHLLKGDLFDSFLLRQCSVHTFAQFDILGDLDKNYYTLQEQETLQRKYCMWSEIKPFVFQIIRGKKLPSSIKIVFSLEEEATHDISQNAAALFLNVHFENNHIHCTTGCAQSNFTLDKSLDFLWDQWITAFFKENGVPTEITK